MNAVIATSQSYNLPAANGDLGGYLTQISEIPILTSDEERELAVRLRDQSDIEAARKLADEAEASRFSALQDYVAAELGQLRTELEDRHNIVLATYGELDDRISRGALPAPASSEGAGDADLG